MLLPEPLIRHNGPTTLQVTVHEQLDKIRWIIRLLRYIPERRGQDFDVIEDVIPLHDLQISVRTPKPVRSVIYVPQQENLAFEEKGGRAKFALPRLNGYQVIALSF